MKSKLTQAQLGIYLGTLNQTETENYNMCVLWTLPADIDLNRLARCIDTVVAAHPYMKSRIVSDENGDLCMETSNETFSCPIVDIDDIDTVKPTLNPSFALMGARLFDIKIMRDSKGAYLFVLINHTIMDGSAFSIFINEVGRAYGGVDIPLEEYTGHDVSLAEQELRASDFANEAREWFLHEYEGVERSVHLMSDNAGKDNFVKESFILNIDPMAVRKASRRCKVARSSFFNAAFSLMISRLSGETRPCYTTVYSGRDDKRLARTFDMLVRTLPVTLDCSPTRTVDELLIDSERQNNDSRRYSTAFSFADFAKVTNIDVSLNFVFQGLLINSAFTLKLGDHALFGEDMRKHEVGFRLNFELLIGENNQHILEVSYNSGEFTHEFIERITRCYETAVNGLATHTDTLGEIPMMTEEDIQATHILSTGETLDYDHNQTFVDVFKQRVAEQPDAIAVSDRDGEITYGTLDSHSDILTAQLISDGVKPNEFVALMMDRSIEFPLSVLAIHKAGAAYTPLDVEYPNERLAYMLENSQAKVLITKHAVLEAKLAEGGLSIDAIKVIYLDDINWNTTIAPVKPLATPQSLAYMIYTSGSTGKPKGVMLHQAGLLNFTWSMVKIEKLTREDRTASHRSFSFDAHIGDIYPILAAGGQLHIMPSEIRKDLQAMADFITSRHINGTGGTTSLMMLLINSFPELPLRFITAGGEKLSGVSSNSMTIINLYGPTECTNDSTTFTINPGEVYDNIPIGRPMPNMRCYIMTADGHMLPQGAAGELVVAGIQVGRGYWQLPEKTAEVFVTRNGETMYRTGDLARYNAKGQIEYLGRIDGQVKLRGYRIELGEIDSVAASCEGIRQAASQVREVNGQRHLVLYYTVEDGTTVTDGTLAAHIEASSLAEYMHPEIYMLLEAMPLLPNGKINRKALPTPEASAEANANMNNTDIELNPLENEIKDIIALALGTDAFGLTTPLSRVGLTSLTAIKVSVLVYKRYGVSLDAKTLGKEGSIRTIANAVVQQLLNANENGNAATITALERTSEKGGVATLSYPQQGVYFDIMKNPDSVAYNIPTCYDMGTKVTVDDVVKAATQVIEAHPILSAHFEVQNGEAVQVIPADVNATIATASVDSDEEFEAMKEDFVQPFDIEKGPLYRLIAVSTPSGVKLLADFLHLVMDGSSLGIFSNQLIAALNGTMPEGEQYDYINYVADEKACRESKEFAESKEYFAQRMTTVDGASCIPEDVKSGEGVQGMLAMASTPVDIKAATAFARTLGITPAALFLAAAGYTVSRYCNTPDVCMATISNGRSNVKVSDTVGMFVNTIALTTHLTDTTIKDFVKACATEFENAVAHENYPFAELSAAYDLHPDVFFQYQLGMHSALKVGNESVEITHFGHPQPKFKMIVSIEEDAAGNARIEMQYDDSCYTHDMAQGLADSMATVLARFIEAPEAPVKKVSMLSKAQAELIATFHETQRAEVPIKLYHKLFEKSAAEHSDSLALAAVDGEFTYDALNRIMNRLAHALIERGIKRGDRVALLLPRTSRLIISQYGVLKAGAAYIPCDPKYPTDRINHIIDDSAAPFIITTADRLKEFPGRAVDVEELLKNTDETNPDVYVEPDDLAYLIYTSGSTGTPKGVQLMHKGVCNYHCDKNLIQSILKNECHAALGITTISFDMSVWETGSPLMLGKTLVLVSDDDCNDPNALAALINKYHVDCMTATTSRFMQLLESEVFYNAFKRNMHMAYQGGEGLSLALLRKLQSFPGLRIVNGYGPTETIANSHASELTVGDIPHIGKPCVNYTNFIVDNDGNELPVGVIGELLIGGASVAKGYNNLPEQTAARFVDGIYHSGDYARWLPDGNVMVLGRKDNQVKLRGLRIELGEVESTMVKVEGIKSAVVLIKKLQGKDHLCAYFTADRNKDIASLKAELKKTLTLYMIPTAYLQVPEFPLTPNGKTNVKALPEPVIAQSTDQVAAANKTEQQFCDIFASILQLDKVGATDDFFELGGTSLVVIKVVIEATKLGYQVAFQDVFAHSTPRALAEFVGATPAQVAQEEKPAEDVASSDVYASVLKDNTLENLIKGERQPIGDVLLTGATGFLGIHVLYHLLKEYDGKIYCPLRGKDGVSAADRMRSMLYYYFDEAFEDEMNTRLFIIETNMMNPDAVMQLPYKNLTVINCLANVKHFSTGNDIEEVNVNSVEYLVKWCLASGSRLVHVSTVSVAGHSMNGFPDPKRRLIERELDYGQSLDNQYARSKFNAERLILDAVRDNGLSAKIMRVGNLSARNSDGEFQMNFMSNNFMATLRAYKTLGACAYDWMDFSCEFSPIDEVSRAILLLATTPRENIVFHPTNNHTLPMGDVLRGMHVIGNDIKFVEKAEFDAVMTEATNDEEKTLRLRPLMAYAASGGNKVVNLGYDNTFTTQALYRLGFTWAYTSWDYVERFIKAMASLDFFD